ncbi:unnamed protein product, partial [Protopolystoma xenopodis]
IYGSGGISQLEDLLETSDVCTDKILSIDNKESLEAFIDLAERLFMNNNTAKVVICFCQGETVGQLFEAMMFLNLTNNGYIIVGSDGWADRTDILGPMMVKQAREQHRSAIAQGSISIRIHSPPVPGFEEHFLSLNPQVNTWNPWFKEFWESKFNCSLEKLHPDLKECSGNFIPKIHISFKLRML